MMNQKEKRGFSNFGFSTILLSFVMICVVTFSALSLITANSDYKLSKKVADKTQSYYEAESRAYEKLTDIDTILLNSYLASADENAYFALIETHTADYGVLTVTPEGYYLSFREEVAKDQHLSIKLRIQHPKEDTDTFYEITEWKSVYTRDFPEEETLNLIQ